MTTRPDHHEPLDAEERDLAARLGRVGPFEGPSPALDAKILAAAHAASGKRVPSRRRHFAWLGVPPALVTGVGVAAAAVLALGLVWQMRPQYGGIAAQAEADAEEEVILIAPTGTTRAPFVNPPPLPESPASSDPAAQPTAVPRKQDTASAASAKAMAAAPAAAPAPTTAATGQLAAQAGVPAEEDKQAVAASPSANDGFVAEPSDSAAPMRENRATYTTAARATAARAATMRRERAAAPAPAPASAPPAAPAAAAAESEAMTLDRIEVTGSRIRDAATPWSEVPVSEDSRLAVDEWLQRIRERRDDGDLDHARASLRLFQREHPRIRLPADLRTLLTTDAKQ